MRQERIISYQELEARVCYLEDLVSKMNQYIIKNKGSIDYLNDFLNHQDLCRLGEF